MTSCLAKHLGTALSNDHEIRMTSDGSLLPGERRDCDGSGRRLLFQDVPEGKSGKNRLHIDVHSEPGGLHKVVARLEDLGQIRVRVVDKGPAGHWWIMQHPEGNEFCAA
jgi:Glyoxalase-like domain